MKKHIPNAITCLNVFCGSLACLFASEGGLSEAAICILVGSLFDFLDGLAARLLNAYSELGKHLDALADMVSFGLAPCLISYQLLQWALFPESHAIRILDLSFLQGLFLFPLFLIPVCSAIRLAQFNIDNRQSQTFLGLPTPANALFFASLALVVEHQKNSILSAWVHSPWFIVAICIVFSLLLVVPIPMFSLKFTNVSFSDNKVRFVFLGAFVLGTIIMGISFLPLTIPLYIVLSVLMFLLG